MNIVKFYRYRRDGSVEQVRVRVTQARRHKCGKQFIGYVRHAENEMLRRGFVRTKLKAVKRDVIVDSVRRALA